MMNNPLHKHTHAPRTPPPNKVTFTMPSISDMSTSSAVPDLSEVNLSTVDLSSPDPCLTTPSLPYTLLPDLTFNLKLRLFLSIPSLVYVYGAIKLIVHGDQWYEFAFNSGGPLAAMSTSAVQLTNVRRPGFPKYEFAVAMALPLAHLLKCYAKLLHRSNFLYNAKWYFAYDELFYMSVWILVFFKCFLPLRKKLSTLSVPLLESHLLQTLYYVLASFTPILFLMMESLDCLFRNYSSGSLSANQTCRGIGIPNFVIGVHLASVCFYRCFFLPFIYQSHTFSDLSKFAIPNVLRIQVLCYGAATLNCVLLFGMRGVDTSMYLVFIVSGFVFALWTVILVAELAHTFLLSLGRRRGHGDADTERPIPSLSRKSTASFIIDRLSSTDGSRITRALATNEEGQIAPIFRLCLMIAPFGTFLCFILYVIRGPWWWVLGKVGGPLGVACAAIHFVCSPAKPLGFEEHVSYAFINLSFVFSIIASLIHDDSTTNSIITNTIQALFFSGAYFVCRQARREIPKNMDPEKYIRTIAFPVAVAGIGPILYISAEPLSCVSWEKNYIELLTECDGLVEPAFVTCTHITCVICFLLFFFHFQTRDLTIANIVKFKFSNLHKVQAVLFGVASVLTFFCLAMKRPGAFSPTAKLTTKMIYFSWMALMVLQVVVDKWMRDGPTKSWWKSKSEDGKPGFLSTESDFELAPLYSLSLFTFPLVQVGCSIMYIIRDEWWWDILTLFFPLCMIAICVVFVSKPRKKLGALELSAFASLPVHLCIQAAAAYKVETTVGSERSDARKSTHVMVNVVLWTCTFPVFTKLRKMLGCLPDAELRHHIRMNVWGKALSSSLPVLYITLDSLACKLGKSRDETCEHIIDPNAAVCFHISCFAGSMLFLSPFSSFSVKRIMRFDVPPFAFLQFAVFVLNSLLAMFVYGVGYTGDVVAGLDPFTTISVGWIFLFVSQFIMHRVQPGRYMKFLFKSDTASTMKNERELEEEKRKRRDNEGNDNLEEVISGMSGEGGLGIGGLGGFDG